MNNINVIERNGVLVTDSREVADMVGKRHSDLLDSINGYVKHLTNGKIRSLDFFIPSTYTDNKGQERPNFLITRKGCDMVANKMTGGKGVLFTATYVNRFYDMETQIKAKSLPPLSIAATLGALASYLRIQRSIMRDQGCTSLEIAVMSKLTCESCGVPIPACLGTPTQGEQLILAGYDKQE